MSKEDLHKKEGVSIYNGPPLHPVKEGQNSKDTVLIYNGPPAKEKEKDEEIEKEKKKKEGGDNKK